MDVEHIHYRLLFGLKYLAFALFAAMFLLFLTAFSVFTLLFNSANPEARDPVSEIGIMVFIGAVWMVGVWCAFVAWAHFRTGLKVEFQTEEPASDSGALPTPQPAGWTGSQAARIRNLPPASRP